MWGNAGRYVERPCNNSSENNSSVQLSAESASMWDNNSSAGNNASENSHTGVSDGENNSSVQLSAESASMCDNNSTADNNSSAVAFPPQTIVITRRSNTFGVIQPDVSHANTHGHNWDHVRDISAIQRFSTAHTKDLAGTYPVGTWRVLGSVLEQSKVTQNKVLKAVSTLLPARARKLWPTTREVLDSKLSKLGCASSRWTRTATIDLSHIDLPELKDPITFKFIDPVVAWVQCAERLSHKHKLYFTYRERLHPDTGEKLYGSSVQHGQIMLQACRKIPNCSEFHTGPALFGLSWDAGNASKRRSYTPILISVGNTDYAGFEVCICIGFMPQLNISEKGSEKAKAKAQRAKHELNQACAGAILEIIEKAAETGFKCLLSTGEWYLFPIVTKMEFDTKERTKFFALARERACGAGSGPRKGRSAFRSCTPHASRQDLQRKRLIIDGAIPATEDEVKNAADSLSRRGTHPHLRCTALSICRHSILQWPGRIYHGLFAFDVMHILYLNWIKYLQDTLLSTMTKTQQQLLDKRVRSFFAFVKPSDGSTSKKVTSLARTAYLSAETRVLHLFLWSHAVGSKATILKAAIRDDALSSICSLQVMCFSVRAKLPFTEAEHRYDTCK